MKTFPATPLLLSLAFAMIAKADEDELHIGRSSTGQLKVEVGFSQPHELEPSVFPGITGHATGLLGIHSIDFDEPTNDLFLLSTNADLKFVLLAKDAGMEIWNDTGSAYMNVGESFNIGQPAFDTHPIWNIPAGVAGIEYSVTIKVHDLTGTHSDSDSIVLSFTPAQIPRPQLSITASASHVATLTWPTNFSGWLLESSASPVSTPWFTVTNQPSITGTNYSLSLNSTNAQNFFRLRSQ